MPLEDFLQQELFGAWPSILTYNRAEGIGFGSVPARSHFQDRLRAYDSVHGTTWSQGLPRDPLNSFALLESYFRICAAQGPARPVVLLLPFAETVAPAGEASYRTPEDRAVVVYLRRWAQDPVLLAKNVVLVLVTESLADIDPQLRRAHATREIEIQRPDPAERLAFLNAVRPASWYASHSEMKAERLAELTAGMNRVQLGQLLDGVDANGETLSRERVRDIKKEVIESGPSTTSPWWPACRRSRSGCGGPPAPSPAATPPRCRWATWCAGRWGAPRRSWSSASPRRSAFPA